MTRKTYIIAEAGVNHNGSLQMAFDLVDAAVEAGADAVKFQTFKAENLVSIHAPKANYQKETTSKSESQFDMLKKLELTEKMHFELAMYCMNKNIKFISTPFDIDSLNLLIAKMNLDVIKVPSGEITNAPFLLEIGRKRKKVILSTGMSTLGEVEQALSILAFGLLKNSETPSTISFYNAYNSLEGQQLLRKYVTILHCTTEYPTPYNEVNLNAMDTLSKAFNLSVGLSDHTKGIVVPIAAVAKGAVIIEKHFTLDKNMEGPDHKASLDPKELAEMVLSIRRVEEALGTGIKGITRSEQRNVTIARKSLIASRCIKSGEVFTEDNIAVKRPGNGISPMNYWDIMGKGAKKEYIKDDIIDE